MHNAYSSFSIFILQKISLSYLLLLNQVILFATSPIQVHQKTYEKLNTIHLFHNFFTINVIVYLLPHAYHFENQINKKSLGHKIFLRDTSAKNIQDCLGSQSHCVRILEQSNRMSAKTHKNEFTNVLMATTHTLQGQTKI